MVLTLPLLPTPNRSVRPRTNNWQPDIVSNGLFEEYYKGQDICPPEVRRLNQCIPVPGRMHPAATSMHLHRAPARRANQNPLAAAVTQEWDAFIAALKRPLPITFRINGQGKFADRLVARLESNFMQQFTEEPVVVSAAPGACSGMYRSCRSTHSGSVWDAAVQCVTHAISAAALLPLSMFPEPTSARQPTSPVSCCCSPVVQIDGEAIEKPHPLEWYPGKLAWQMNFSRAQVRAAAMPRRATLSGWAALNVS